MKESQEWNSLLLSIKKSNQNPAFVLSHCFFVYQNCDFINIQVLVQVQPSSKYLTKRNPTAASVIHKFLFIQPCSFVFLTSTADSWSRSGFPATCDSSGTGPLPVASINTNSPTQPTIFVQVHDAIPTVSGLVTPRPGPFCSPFCRLLRQHTISSHRIVFERE